MREDQTAQLDPLRISIEAAGGNEIEGVIVLSVRSLRIYATISKIWVEEQSDPGSKI